MKKIEIISELRPATDFPSSWYEIADKNHFWCIWRYQVFERFLKKNKISLNENLLVLDIGCGNGLVRDQIESEGNWTMDGVDVDINVLSSPQNSNSRGTTYFYNILEKNSLLKERYDCIILFDVLEHIDDPKSFLDASLFHLKKGGYLFINVPAFESLRSKYDTVAGHLIRYTKDTLLAAVKENGLACVDAGYWGFLLYPIGILRKIILKLNRNDDKVIKQGFYPPARWINKVFIGLMKFEFIFSFANSSVGSSLFMISKKE